jgi:hypothetical protein
MNNVSILDLKWLHNEANKHKISIVVLRRGGHKGLKLLFKAFDGYEICRYWAKSGLVLCRHTGDKINVKDHFAALDAAIAERQQEIENTKHSGTIF